MDRFDSMAEALAAHGYLANPEDKERVAYCLRIGYTDPSAKGEADELAAIRDNIEVVKACIGTALEGYKHDSSWVRPMRLTMEERAKEYQTAAAYLDNASSALDRLVARRPSAEPAADARELDNNRCAICGWPLERDGCQRGDCSMRPFPARYYDAERARREYESYPLPEEAPPTATEQYTSQMLAAALQRERDEAAEQAKAWYCADVPEDELDSFGRKALDDLLAAIRSEHETTENHRD